MAGRYRTIVADPPWHYDGFTGYSGPRSARRPMRPLPYGSMTVEQIGAVPVSDLADPEGCNVFLWTTNRYLPCAFVVLERWRAQYRQLLVWHKTGASPVGSVAFNSCEYLLFARINGGQPFIGPKLRDAKITTPRPGAGRHSTKPEVWLDLIETVSPSPYLEMFSRRARIGWDTWGNESLHGGEAS